jgi:hypothetical protein
MMLEYFVFMSLMSSLYTLPIVKDRPSAKGTITGDVFAFCLHQATE